jgi:hypothetical protein
MFLGDSASDTLDPIDVLQPGRDEFGRYIFKFEGCYDDRSLGADTSGDVYLSSLTMMPAKMDSGPFGVKLCKDEDCKQVIAILEKELEPIISEDRMILNDMASSSCSISALIDRVQIRNLITI